MMIKLHYKKLALVVAMALSMITTAYGLTELQQKHANYQKLFGQLSQQTSMSLTQQENEAANSAFPNGSVDSNGNTNNQTSPDNSNQNNQDLPSCDCYNQQDPYNILSSNFYYNSKSIRTYRIKPHCKCNPPQKKQKTASAKNTATASSINIIPPVTKNNGSAKPASSSAGSSPQFNIQY